MTIDSVTVAGVTKRFGHQRALTNVNATLRDGSLCALLGPNGAGKSTLLGILSTLVKPSAGEVIFAAGDSEPPQGAELRGQIGVLAHDAFIYGGLTALENLAFYARLYGIAGADERAAKLLDEVGLDDRARVKPARDYSRGMLQRLALARALLHDPKFLLLDEPFTGLDRTGAAALGASLARAKQERKIVLVVTHDLEALDGVCDHVLVLRRGKKVLDQRSQGFSYGELKDCYHQFED